MNTLEEFRLDGQSAVVTGASRGIGRALAEGLAEAGANVCVVNRDLEHGKAVADSIADSTDVETHAVAADVTDEDEVEMIACEAFDEFGSIEILVNNAGIARTSPAHEMSLATWNTVLETNLTGTFLCTKHIGGAMIEAEINGVLVNNASMSAFVANYPQEEAVYHASKGGVVSFTRQIASEWAKYGIRANALAPGYIRTEMIDDLVGETPAMGETWRSEMLMDDMAPPDALKGSVVYLASDASAYMTGETIIVDGGYTVR